MVRGVDHNRVVGQSGRVEIIEHRPNRLVERLDAGEIVGHVALVFPAHEIISLRTLLEDVRTDSVVDLVPLLALGLVHPILTKGHHLVVQGQVHGHPQGHVLRIGGGASSLVVVEQVFRLGIVLADVFLQKMDRRKPKAVRRLVLHHQHEWFLLVPVLLQPVD